MTVTKSERTKLDLILGAAAGLVFLSLFVYWVLGLLAVLGLFPWLRSHIEANIAGNIGVPGAALASFLLVYFLTLRFPPRNVEGEIQIKLFGAEFSGPAGPVGLWVFSFLALVFAIWLFRLPHAA